MTNTNKVGMKDLVAQMVEKYGYTKDDSEAVMTDLVEMIAKHVKDGKSVELGGVGSFAAVEERDANDRVTYRPVYTPGKAMREAGASRTRLAVARERRYQRVVVRKIYGMQPDDAWWLLNMVSPITADTQTGLVTLDTLSVYYGMTKRYLYGILGRFELSRENHPDMIRRINADGMRSVNGYDMRVALAMSVLMCFGRKSVLNSRAKAVYEAVKASEIGVNAMEKASKLDRVPRKRRGRKAGATAAEPTTATLVTVVPQAAEAFGVPAGVVAEE